MRGQIKVKFNFVQLNSKKCQFLFVFVRKLRFLSPHKAIEIPSASNFKDINYKLGAVVRYFSATYLTNSDLYIIHVIHDNYYHV